MYLSQDDKNAYWRAGMNGGWRGAYEAGLEAGLQRAQGIVTEYCKEQSNSAYTEIGVRINKRVKAEIDKCVRG